MRRERGFTLIELMLALSLSALVVLLAHRVLAGVVDGAARLSEARTALDRDMNARRWLIEAFGSLDVGMGGASFAGRPDRVEFTTTQLVPKGWLEGRRTTIARAGDSLVVTFDVGERLVLARDIRAVAFDYLLDPGATATWVREWMSPVSAPLAVRMRTRSGERVDTLLLLVGPRG